MREELSLIMEEEEHLRSLMEMREPEGRGVMVRLKDLPARQVLDYV
jgi:hypothetical protein